MGLRGEGEWTLLDRYEVGWQLSRRQAAWLGSNQEGTLNVSYRIRLLQSAEGCSLSCLDLPGSHSQGDTREEALVHIREAIDLWLEVEAE